MTGQAFSQVQLVQLGELLALQVENDHAEALIALQGAQVLAFRLRGEEPLIWLSEQAAFQRGQSVRGGIPVCWPWFGEISRNPEAVQAGVASDRPQPAHGLVRSLDWILESVHENAEGCSISLRFPVPAGLTPAWNFEAELRLRIQVGRRLSLHLETTNRGTAPLPLTQALHTYFAISHVDQVSLVGLDGAPYIDTLEQWQTKAQQGPVRIEGEVDRIYLNVPQEIVIADAQWQRNIHIRALGSASAVVWNPWIDKSTRLSQFAPDAWQRMFCVETANVMQDMVMLDKDASHSLRVEYWTQPHG